MRAASKPIRVFYSVLSERFYATRAWKECTTPDGKHRYIEVTGQKFDVTDDIAGLIKQHSVSFAEKAEDHRRIARGRSE